MSRAEPEIKTVHRGPVDDADSELHMDKNDFNSVVQSFNEILGGHSPDWNYDDRTFWETVGIDPLDLQITALADFYRRCNADDRLKLRNMVEHRIASWPLVAYVRRQSVQVLKTSDPTWLERALSIACLENAKCDFRDSITSLVIVRAAAETVGIDPVPYFNVAISECDPSMIMTLKNARDHTPPNVRDLLRMFGPPQLKPKRKRS